MANAYHDQLTGSDLHDNRVCPATGTALSSWAPLDARFAALSSFLGHLANTSNPHSVTAAQVGNNLAQWNASLLHGRTLDNTVTPLDGHVLTWDATTSSWKPMAVQVPTLVVGPAGSGAKVQCTGVNDGAKIKAAISALPGAGAAGYRLYFLNGTYYFNDINDNSSFR
jgi:hypothetical protein